MGEAQKCRELHRVSKAETFVVMKTINTYVKETCSGAFREIHIMNHDVATTKLVDALWAPIGDAATANIYS